MPQLSLYVDDAMMSQLKESASAEGLSLSRFTAEAIRDRICARQGIVQDGRWDRLYGSLGDDDSFVRPKQLETRPIERLDVS